MLMSVDEGTQPVTFLFSDGEALTFQTSTVELVGERRIVNGGLHDAALVLASVVASNVVGNTAYDALRLGLRFLKLRLRWGNEDDQRPYVCHIAQLAVAMKLDEPCEVKAVSCVRQADHWEAVVIADGRTYRVQIPPDDPRPTAISVDLD
jgi:hypothetical protein